MKHLLHIFTIFILFLSSACGGDTKADEIPGISIDANGVIRLVTITNSDLTKVISEKRCNGQMPNFQIHLDKVKWIDTNCSTSIVEIPINHPDGKNNMNMKIYSALNGKINADFFHILRDAMLSEYPPDKDNIPFIPLTFFMLTPLVSTGDFPNGNLINYTPVGRTEGLSGDVFVISSAPIKEDNSANILTMSVEFCQAMEIFIPDLILAERRCNGFGFASAMAWGSLQKPDLGIKYADYKSLMEIIKAEFGGQEVNYIPVSEGTYNLLVDRFKGLATQDWFLP